MKSLSPLECGPAFVRPTTPAASNGAAKDSSGRSGTPADLAWSEACRELAVFESELALLWGGSMWSQERAEDSPVESEELSRWLRTGLGRELGLWGQSLRQSLSVSVWEGRPCLDRLESALRQLRGTTQAVIDTELQKLSLRALIPLFACSAPAVLGLLGFGLFLSWRSFEGGGGP
jgi:hypothetical protein